jgi:hypothetical protein
MRNRFRSLALPFAFALSTFAQTRTFLTTDTNKVFNGGNQFVAATVQTLAYVRYADQFAGGDCGARINAADSDLSTAAGEILVNQNCGLAITTPVTVSADHVLRFIQGGNWKVSDTICLSDNTEFYAPKDAIFTLATATNKPILKNCNANASMPLSSESRMANVVTATTARAHGLNAGQTVWISDSNPAGTTIFNGAFVIATVPSSTTFTYTQTAGNDISTGGRVILSGNGNSNLTIDGGWFDGNGLNQSTNNGAIYMAETKLSTFRNIKIARNASSYSNRATDTMQLGAFDCVACERDTFLNLQITDGWENGLAIALGKFNQIEKGYYSNNGSSGIDDSSSDHEHIAHLEALSNRSSAVSLNSPYSTIEDVNAESTKAAAGITLGHEGYPCNGCRAIANNVRNNAMSGIRVQGSTTNGVEIVGNYVEGQSTEFSAGISCGSGATGIAVIGNTVVGNYFGIQGCSKSTFVGNRVTASLTNGIQFAGVTNSTVSANDIWNNGSSRMGGSRNGIHLDSASTGNVVCGNRLWDDDGGNQTTSINILAQSNTICSNDYTGSGPPIGASGNNATTMSTNSNITILDTLTLSNASELLTPGSTLSPSNAGGNNLGTIALPWGSLFIGNAATNNIIVTGAATSARQQTLQDATGIVPLIIASGTSTLGSGAIRAGDCASIVTTAATGALTSDTISWAFASAPTTADGALNYAWYLTNGKVNWKVCNPGAGSITPGGLVINWRVVR